MKRFISFPWRGLTPQLFLIAVLPLTILLLLVTFGGLALHQRAMRDLVGERDERAARAAASALTEQLYHRLNAIRGLALRPDPGSDFEAYSQVLDEYRFLLADFESGLAFYSTSGELLASIGSGYSWPEQFSAVAPELQAAFEASDIPVILSETHILPSGTLMFAAARPGSQGAVAVGAFSPDILASGTLANVVPPETKGEVFLVDQRGQVIFRAGQALEGGDSLGHLGVTEALNGRSGAAFLDLPGAEHVVAYSPVPLARWALVIEEPWESVTSPVLRLTENAPLILIPVIIVTMLALWFGTTRIVEPLRQLEGKAARLGWGDYRAVEEPVGGVSEIRHLQGEMVHLAHKVRAAQKGLRDYIGAMTAGQEEERRRLARELHDDTIQSLIALNQRIQLLHMGLEEKPASNGTVKEVAELQELAEGTIQNLRRLTRALRPIYLEDLGLTTALEMLTLEMSQSGGLAVRYEQEGPVRRLDNQVELALYRMAQEALSNVVRHAQATQAGLRITFTEEEVRLDIKDNGQGFSVPESPAEFAPGGHFGLLGLHERAEMIGARLSIESNPREGTRVLVSLPLSEASNRI